MYRRILNFLSSSIFAHNPDRAERKKLMWALVYGIAGWNLFTFIIYATGKEGKSSSLESRERLYKKLTGQGGEVKTYHVRGFTYLGSETVNLEDGSIKEIYRNPAAEDSLGENKSANSQLFKWPSKEEPMSTNETQDQPNEAADNLPSEL